MSESIFEDAELYVSTKAKPGGPDLQFTVGRERGWTDLDQAQVEALVVRLQAWLATRPRHGELDPLRRTVRDLLGEVTVETCGELVVGGAPCARICDRWRTKLVAALRGEKP